MDNPLMNAAKGFTSAEQLLRAAIEWEGPSPLERRNPFPDREEHEPIEMTFIDPHNIEAYLPNNIPEDEIEDWTLGERLEDMGYLTFGDFNKRGRVLLERRIPIGNGEYAYHWYSVQLGNVDHYKSGWLGVRCYPLGFDPKREVYDCNVDFDLKYCFVYEDDDLHPDDFSDIFSNVKLDTNIGEQQINETDFIINNPGLVTRFIHTGNL